MQIANLGCGKLAIILLRYLNVFYAAFRDLDKIDPFFPWVIELLGTIQCSIGQNDEGYFIMPKHLGDLGCGIFLLSQVLIPILAKVCRLLEAESYSQSAAVLDEIGEYPVYLLNFKCEGDEGSSEIWT